MNCIFFVMYTPLSVAYIMLDIYKFQTSTNPVQLATIQMFYNITLAISFIYNALPFFINFAFNKLFRNEASVFIQKCLFIYKSPHQQTTISKTFSLV